MKTVSAANERLNGELNYSNIWIIARSILDDSYNFAEDVSVTINDHTDVVNGFAVDADP